MKFQVSIATFLEKLYPAPEKDTGKAHTQFTNVMNKIMQRLARESNRLGVPLNQFDEHETSSLWLLVNAITGFVQHDKTRHGNVSPEQRERMAMSDPDSIAAWSLADTLAS